MERTLRPATAPRLRADKAHSSFVRALRDAAQLTIGGDDGVGESQAMDWLAKTLKERPKWVAAGVIFFILVFLVGWGGLFLERYMEGRARDTVLSALSELSPNATVTINGEAREPSPVLQALRRIHHVESHHSHPLKPIEIEIRDGAKTIKLIVAQDSERPDEYWVYQPGRNYHNDSLGKFLGCTETQVFR